MLKISSLFSSELQNRVLGSFVEQVTGIRLSPNIFNLSEDFREKQSKKHTKGQCPCKRIEGYLGIDPDALVDAIPWMRENEIPPCIWALGGVFRDDPDGTLIDQILSEETNMEFVDIFDTDEMDEMMFKLETDIMRSVRYSQAIASGSMFELLENTAKICAVIVHDNFNIVLLNQCMLLYYTTKCHKNLLPKTILAKKTEPTQLNPENVVKTIYGIQPISEVPQKPIDDIMAEFDGLSLNKSKDKKQNDPKQKTKKAKKSKEKQPRSRPKISRITKTKSRAQKDEDDEQSRTANQFNKRHTKTKKPPRG